MSSMNPYQYRSIFRSLKIKLSSADELLLASLPRLATVESSEAFASCLLDIMRPHPLFAMISRVCLVKRLGQSNQIAVVSSANRSEELKNSMPAGYSCFITSQGSIFQLIPGTLRTYESAKAIVDQFANDHRPPQRSIARIAAMGFQSGIVIPSFVDHNFLQGALFFNFEGANPLFQTEADYALINVLEGYAHSQLNKSGINPFRSIQLPPAAWVGQAFSSDKLQEVSCSLDPTIRIDVENTIESDFVVSHGNLAVVLVQAALLLQQPRIAIAISLEAGTDNVRIRLLASSLSAMGRVSLQHFVRAAGYSLQERGSELILTLVFEKLVAGEPAYSIE